MPVERICPQCGTSNPIGQARCIRCGINLILPATRPVALPIRIPSRNATALALGIGALAARIGLKIVTGQVLPRLAKRLTRSASASPRARTRAEESPAVEEPEYTIRGWRTWTIRHGSDEASGSEHVEWRMSRRRDGGAKRE